MVYINAKGWRRRCWKRWRWRRRRMEERKRGKKKKKTKERGGGWRRSSGVGRKGYTGQRKDENGHAEKHEINKGDRKVTHTPRHPPPSHVTARQ